MKWLTPDRARLSCRPPEAIQIPKVTLSTCGMGAVIILAPFPRRDTRTSLISVTGSSPGPPPPPPS